MILFLLLSYSAAHLYGTQKAQQTKYNNDSVENTFGKSSNYEFPSINKKIDNQKWALINQQPKFYSSAANFYIDKNDVDKCPKVLSSSIKNKNLYGSSYPGPTIVMPSTTEIENIITSSQTTLSNTLNSLVTVAISDVSASISTYTSDVISAASTSITSGLSDLQTNINIEFSNTTTSLTSDIQTILENAINATTSGTTSANTSLIAALSTRLSLAASDIQAVLKGVAPSTLNNLTIIVEDGGASLYSQIVSILTNNSSISSILSEITYSNSTSIQNAIIKDVTGVAVVIITIIDLAYNDMTSTVLSTLETQGTDQATILSNTEDDMLTALSINLAQLLNGIYATIVSDTTNIANSVNTIIQNKIGILTSSVTSIVSGLNSDITNAIDSSTSGIISAISTKIYQNKDDILSQINSIFTVS
ncbi:hypothetical protein EDEG_01033 [Edhazardia aedis USNM 41457]|uniref:Plasma membrane fusion protein PRM1 n=1 Tax=Edhazardia aedis (strain USNM 41457) TaxID=1003232 RepID=J8ZYK1_EDHAE|nr:hypothetical protein EDEG_01033 [Edhazardia aedis USNM 41457]|eukprot:EJW04743.1 hypothetical protein EDEG_01033 [Edhazardia aedis USNM 41457]